MGIKLSELMMRQYKDGVYRMSRVTVAKHVAQLEEENAALKEETERLRDGIRDVRKHIAPMHTAYDMLLILLAQESE